MASKTKKAAKTAVKTPKAAKVEDPRRYQVFYDDPDLGRRQAYPGPGVERKQAEQLAEGLVVEAYIILVPGTEPNDGDSNTD